MGRFVKFSCAAGLLAVALVACSKSTTSTTTTASVAPAASNRAPASSSARAPKIAMNGAQATAGAKVFATNCSSCHQASGAGIAGTFPPLAGNPVVVGDPRQVIHIVKYGMTGSVAVLGHSYNGVMPVWSTQLSATDIASAITYIRSAWGNNASAVSEADVKAVKQ